MDKPCLVATASLMHAAVDPPPWWRIIHEVASAHGFTVSRVRGPDRTFPVCAARQEAMWRIKRETPLTIQMIGRRFGRDHSTVVRSIERHERRANALPLPAGRGFQLFACVAQWQSGPFVTGRSGVRFLARAPILGRLALTGKFTTRLYERYAPRAVSA